MYPFRDHRKQLNTNEKNESFRDYIPKYLARREDIN